MHGIYNYNYIYRWMKKTQKLASKLDQMEVVHSFWMHE